MLLASVGADSQWVRCCCDGVFNTKDMKDKGSIRTDLSFTLVSVSVEIHRVVNRIFSPPAHCGGRRAKQILSPDAGFALAGAALVQGAMLGDIFTFVSGLYRGKLTYARRFAAPPEVDHPIVGRAYIITSNAGLGLERLSRARPCWRSSPVISTRQWPVSAAPEQSASVAAKSAPNARWCCSAASRRPSVTLWHLRRAAPFPIDFVGRGDMSRGGLLLRRAQEGVELACARGGAPTTATEAPTTNCTIAELQDCRKDLRI